MALTGLQVTSLLEGLVWGHRAAENFLDTLKEHPQPKAEEFRRGKKQGHTYRTPHSSARI